MGERTREAGRWVAGTALFFGAFLGFAALFPLLLGLNFIIGAIVFLVLWAVLEEVRARRVPTLPVSPARIRPSRIRPNRDWLLPIEVSPAARVGRANLVDFVLTEGFEPPLDLEVSDGRYLVYIEGTRRQARRARKKVLQTLAEAGAGDVALPGRLRRWDGRARRFVDPSDPAGAELEPVPPRIGPDEIAWLVSVRPRSVFDEPAVRRELASRGRIVVGEKGRALEIGCRDEADAHALIADLSTLPEVGPTSARELGRVARWTVRQRLAGNYAGSTRIV